MLRRERAQLAGELARLLHAALDDATGELRGARDVAAELLGAGVDDPRGAREDGPRPQLLDAVDLAAHLRGEAHADSGSRLLHARQLLGDVRDDALGGVGGVDARRSATSSSSGRSASCPMALTSGVRHAAAVRTSFVAEDEQVLEVAAAASDDDDVDLGILVEHPDGARDLAGGPVALHRRVHDAEPDARPAQLGVPEHVLLGVRVLAGDEADAAGEERQAALAVGVEEALGAGVWRRRSSRSSRSPRPTWRISSTCIVSVPPLTQ